MMNESKKIFLETLNGRTGGKVPFWFMRQAGRYLPEYRALREKKGGFLAMAFDPDAACEITMQPIRRFGMDAAIIFSDILTIPYALGQPLEFVHGEGPKLDALKNKTDLERLSFESFDQKLEPVYQALKNARSALCSENMGETALIGFAGAPWTVATYMLEGGGSRSFSIAKKWMNDQENDFKILIDKLVEATSKYLIKQIEAGAEAIQIFDSWAGALDQKQFEKFSLKPAQKIVANIHKKFPQTPIIGFPKGAGENYIAYAKQTGITAIGLDQNVDAVWAAKELQTHLPVQGNLDPELLITGGEAMKKSALNILESLAGGAHIFNLGHGINKDTPVQHVEELVRIIREFRN